MPLNPAEIPAHINPEFRLPEGLLEQEGPSLPEIYAWNAKHNPDYPLFVYHDGEKLQYITHSVANRAIDCAARYIVSSLGPYTTDGTTQRTLGIFANTDTITFLCTVIGVLRSGWTVFLISTRNTAAAIADMVKKTGTSHILVSRDSVMGDIATEAIKGLASVGINLEQHAMPEFEDLFSENRDPDSPFSSIAELPLSINPDSDSVIMHSSGSTGHPKPIRWSHKHLAAWGKEPLTFEANVKCAVMSCLGTPMFHGLGCFMYSTSPIMGFVIATFKPTSPPIVPTPDAVWEGIVASRVDYTWSVPSFVEQWARDPEKVQIMKQMKGVIFGGAMLDEQTGNALAAQGVSLFSAYGTTEVGLVNSFARENPGMDWAYWTLTPGTQGTFRLVDGNTYELVVLSPPDNPLPVVNTKENGMDAYATSDLVEPHPTKPGLWKIVGRADEQIILSNGEKTNPIPLERIINADPHVNSSVIFGRGKFQNGVLVEPKEVYTIEPNNEKHLEMFRNLIWPTMERVNEYAPQHSRIFKEMILVASPSKPFLFNAKGLPCRSIILQEYHEEIERAYREVDNSAQSGFAPPVVWDAQSTLEFIRNIVESTLHRSVADNADIFRNGGDSLQATWIRNTISRAVRKTDKEAAKHLPMNIVFAAPTISGLAKIVHGILSGAEGGHSHTPQDLWKYVERHSTDFPPRPAKLVDRPAGKDVVLITGTTGGFGCDALEHLLRDETVGRVYAFNRKDSKAGERQRTQFRARGLDETLLDSPKFVLVEAQLHEPVFGIELSLLDEIRQSVTHILHNAWKVDFNLSVASFGVDIQGARNLIDLALSSPFIKPPTVLFVSSIGVFGNTTLLSPVAEEPIDDPESSFGIGYSESKWVTEHVLQIAAERTDVHTVVVRLGQIAGDRLGYWNEREWFPALVKSALFQRCLPGLKGAVSWFPAYEAAKAFTEMRHSPHPVLHLVHPRPTPWHTIITPIAEAFGVTLVTYEKWLSTLQEGVQQGSAEEVEAMKVNPALRLLSFFKSQGRETSSDREPMGIVRLSTEKATSVSQALASLPELNAERARKWVEGWKKSGFLVSVSLAHGSRSPMRWPSRRKN